ncbi:MAG: hypothetical protein ACKVS8_06030 [Phycisphaerales bacterium]
MTRPSRFKRIASRWLDVVAYAFCGSAIWVLAGPWITRRFEPAADAIGALSPVAIVYGLLGVVAAAWFLTGRGRSSGWLGVRHPATYPPVWFSAIVAIAVRHTQLAGSNGGASALVDDFRLVWWWWMQLQPWGWPLAVVAAGALVARSLARDVRLRGFDAHAAMRAPASVSVTGVRDFADIERWVRDDSEIAAPCDDYLDHCAVAKRIASRLRADGEAPTVAVVGPLGSGKSSIRGLTQFYLRNDRRVRFVHLSLWPFESPEAAVRGVLGSLLHELGLHVNSLALAGLPEDYVLAVEQAGGLWAGIGRLVRGSTDPAAVVRRLDEVAGAIGIRLVIWVEDLGSV